MSLDSVALAEPVLALLLPRALRPAAAAAAGDAIEIEMGARWELALGGCTEEQLGGLLAASAGKRYIVRAAAGGGRARVVLHEDASGADQAAAYFHAWLVLQGARGVLAPVLERRAGAFAAELARNGWSLERGVLGAGRWRYNWAC